ncbi:MAG: HIT family protein [Fimbriimonadaceae bacterium]
MTLIHKFVEECRAGTLDRCLGRMSSGWAVMGDPQVREGYCLLYPDPIPTHLNELSAEERTQFMVDMTRIGDAILACTDAARINYEILGNLEPALHAHVVPRFDNENALMRTKPIWLEDWEVTERFSLERHGELFAQLKSELGF